MKKRIKLEFKKDRNSLDLQEIESQYKPNNSIFNEDEELMIRLKSIIFSKLSETERNIILAYAEIRNQSKLGELLGVSAATCNKEIKRIREKIFRYL